MVGVMLVEGQRDTEGEPELDMEREGELDVEGERMDEKLGSCVLVGIGVKIVGVPKALPEMLPHGEAVPDPERELLTVGKELYEAPTVMTEPEGLADGEREGDGHEDGDAEYDGLSDVVPERELETVAVLG